MAMIGSTSDEYLPPCGSSSVQGLSASQSVESLVDWRSCDQVDNGTPSTSPPFWDMDDDEDYGLKPSDLYGKFSWKIKNFSQINKRELKSEVFDAGGYKWYILIYPQGCDVCNHLSLFLCVANHDKLLPGWSHFAQFTIAVLNKDPKKNKHSDTLHRFWKKEHDWGWKKFLELAKVIDGFVDEDTLTIKAQVQVIREKAHRPFRCLDRPYRRELIRVYLANVEHNYAQFVKERRTKFQILVEDKANWSSFRTFWRKYDQTTQRYMSRDKTDVVLKVVVKHFFIDKEVTSTLVMDSLYTGLKALERQSRINKTVVDLLEKDELPAPIVLIENDMFVLADDVSVLVERAALDLPHPPLPSKEEKGLPNRSKDGVSADEFNRDSALRDERRLTELGRRTLEIFVLAHIFSRIEIAYQEDVALKRQDELIREEEAAEQAENEKRERKTKKKQAKQRRNNRKAKDRVKCEKPGGMKDKNQLQNCQSDERVLEFSAHSVQVNEKVDPRIDVSDVSDAGDDAGETLQPDVDGRDTSPISWETDTSEIHPRAETSRTEVQNGHAHSKFSSSMDDSSSTCSTDSVPSVVDNGPYKGNFSPEKKNNQASFNRGDTQRNKSLQNNTTSDADQLVNVEGTCRTSQPEPEASFKDQIQILEQHAEKESEAAIGTNKLIDQGHVDEEVPSKSGTIESYSTAHPLSCTQSTPRDIITTINEQVSTSSTAIQTDKSVSASAPKSEGPKNSTQGTTNRAPSISRPASTPVILSQKPRYPLASPSHRVPSLSRSLSTISCSNNKPSPFAESFQPQSYRNAMMGINAETTASTGRTTAQSSASSSSSSSLLLRTPQTAKWKHQTSANLGLSFGSLRPESLHKPQLWTHKASYDVSSEPTISSGQSQGALQDDFPHLDIINDLLDEDRIVGRAGFDDYYDDYSLNQQFTFPQDLVTAADVDSVSGEYYYDDVSQLFCDSFLPFNGLDFSVYGNGMDSFSQSQWPIGSSMNFGAAMDYNGYAYQLPQHSARDVGGYGMMYQPSNGL